MENATLEEWKIKKINGSQNQLKTDAFSDFKMIFYGLNT